MITHNYIKNVTSQKWRHQMIKQMKALTYENIKYKQTGTSKNDNIHK
jgi:hypothetical protein